MQRCVALLGGGRHRRNRLDDVDDEGVEHVRRALAQQRQEHALRRAHVGGHRGQRDVGGRSRQRAQLVKHRRKRI
jgi:hypothetical protein